MYSLSGGGSEGQLAIANSWLASTVLQKDVSFISGHVSKMQNMLHYCVARPFFVPLNLRKGCSIGAVVSDVCHQVAALSKGI